MNGLLSTYIKLLFESKFDDYDRFDIDIEKQELENKYKDIIDIKQSEYDLQPTQEEINNKMSSGWNEIKQLSKLLKMAINRHKQYQDNQKIMENVCTDVLKYLGYQIIGEGASRIVFSRDDVDFVIKLARNVKGSFDNFYEVNNYINHMHLNSNIYPKLLSYDRSQFNLNKLNEKKDINWIIMEKVSVIAKSDAATETITSFYHIEEILPIFCSELNTVLDYMQDVLTDSTIIQLKDEIKSKPAFYWDVISMLMVESVKNFEDDERIPDDGSEFELRYMKYRQSENILPLADAVASMSTTIKDKQAFIKLFVQTCQQFNLFQSIPADLMYLYNTFSDVMYEDMHLMNLGIKEKVLKAYPNEPWKALCILDYGENAIDDWNKLSNNRRNNLF